MSSFSLNDGEKNIYKVQATSKTTFSVLQGTIYLTNKRIAFVQVTKEIFEIGLDKILDVSIVKEKWIFGCRIKQLCITYRYGERQRDEYIGVANPKILRGKIKESMTFMLMEGCGG